MSEDFYQLAHRAHCAQYSTSPEVRAAGKAWFEVDDRDGFTDRDKRRLKAKLEAAFVPREAAPADPEADP